MTQQESEYRVLARKYRPQNFDELIGQDALVTTLKNSIESGRIAHAFMLTGIRGTGKTTTARIIAKALNYTGADGQSGPTVGDTSDCSVCQAITEDRHPDVMEMDAASRTGIDDIREILDGVRYAPVSARYKIYIIDEVHMLSKQAFNALLKTLEEPPSHVKFIFATTEIRKVPVTILSRCQRFDLKRVDVPVLEQHFEHLCALEKVTAEKTALTLIAQAADGSVRDGLSLLDQGIALGVDNQISEDEVASMLGATDRVRILDLIEMSLGGKPKESLEIIHDLYRMGADPRLILQDMMDMIHGLSLLAVSSDIISSSLPHAGLDKAKAIATQLTVPQLQKAWQILLKGLGELSQAANPQKAAEMIILRLIYAADLPDPATLIKKIKKDMSATAPSTQMGQNNNHSIEDQPTMMVAAGGNNVAIAPGRVNELDSSPESIEAMIKLFEERGEILIATHLYQDLVCTQIKKGHFEFKAYDHAPADLAGRIRTCLNNWTGDQWIVSVVTDAGSKKSLAQLDQAKKDADINKIKERPEIRNVLEVFPSAEIIRIFNPKEEG